MKRLPFLCLIIFLLLLSLGNLLHAYNLERMQQKLEQSQQWLEFRLYSSPYMHK